MKTIITILISVAIIGGIAYALELKPTEKTITDIQTTKELILEDEANYKITEDIIYDDESTETVISIRSVTLEDALAEIELLKAKDKDLQNQINLLK